MKRQESPWLSILIPAYEYPTGVLRILNLIYLSNENNIECIVGDDSNSKLVESMVKSHKLYFQGRVSYLSNKNTFGAVKNWNNLLSCANGEYVLLMHHDECPENLDFFFMLRDLIEKSKKPDIVFLRCSLPLLLGKRLRYHMPFFLKNLFLKLVPDYLILHNVIGSPSNVVVRNNICLEFDEDLKWIVDVEWMVRLIRQSKGNWVIGRNLPIMSLYNVNTSITASLGSQIPEIRFNEIKKVQNKLSNSSVFDFIFPITLTKKLISILEKITWIVIRIILIVIGYFFNRPLPNWLKKENDSF